MKKKSVLIIVCMLLVGLITACGTSTTKNNNQAGSNNQVPTKSPSEVSDPPVEKLPIVIDKLKVSFVPSKDPDEIITTTEPLKQLLINQLATQGYEVKEVQIDVGTTYEAVGEALSAGTTDIGLIPGGTYVLYDDGAEVILTSTRKALSIDSDSPKDWNDNKPTLGLDDQQASYYRALIIAGPSPKGQELSQKVNNGEELSWDDLASANWAVMSTSSSAGYIYPTIWLQDKFNKKITDLQHVTQSDSYGTSFARLAAGQFDVLVTYADARRDNEQKWMDEFGGTASIWEQTNVIGVTAPIYNDTVSVSRNSPIMNDELMKAIQDAFIAIAETEEGKEVIAVYSHEGYMKANASDYDNERKAQDLIRSMK